MWCDSEPAALLAKQNMRIGFLTLGACAARVTVVCLSASVYLCICLCSAVLQVSLNATLRPCACYIKHAKGTYRVRTAKKLSLESYRR